MTLTLEIYLPWRALQRYKAGKHRFYNAMHDGFQDVGFDVKLIESTDANMEKSKSSNAFMVYHRNTPQTENTIEARPSYVGPFWAMNSSSIHTEKKAYLATFDSSEIAQKRADSFFANWAERVVDKDAPNLSERDYALVALQGKLLTRRSWQRVAPINMVAQLAEADPNRRIFVKLHPGEDYSDVELKAVQSLKSEQVELVDGDLSPLLANCAYTASINSSVSFLGLFHRKPGILFGDMDSHHLFQKVGDNTVAECLQAVQDTELPFEKYVYWFLHEQMIHAGKNNAKDQILERCYALGWDMGDYRPDD